IPLLRRAHLDLTGLPPTPAETEAFLADTAPDAYERLVDRLLDSPHYGARWGRHWLDIAGYADSDGYSDADPPRAYAYKYREYVQCHAHGYVPNPQNDYYHLRAIFDPAYEPKNWRTPEQRLVALYTGGDRKKAAEVEAEAKKMTEEKAAKQKQYIDEALTKHL